MAKNGKISFTSAWMRPDTCAPHHTNDGLPTMADENGRDMHGRKAMVVVAVVSIFAMGGCGNSASSGSKASGAASDSQRVVKVGVDPGFGMPFVSYKGGTFTGFQSEYYAALGKEMNAKFQLVSIKFDSMTPALKASRIDVAAGGFGDNVEREKSINVIDNIQLGIIGLVKSGSNITKLADLCGGKTVAIPAGSTEYALLIKKASATCPNGKSVKSVNLDTSAGPLAVKSGRIGVYMIDNISGGYIASQSSGGLEVAKLSDAPALITSGDGTRKDAAGMKLAQEIASATDKAVSDGTMAPILKKYGLTPDTIPSPVTVNQPSS